MKISKVTIQSKNYKSEKNGKSYTNTYYHAYREYNGIDYDLNLNQLQLKALAYDFGLTDIKELEGKDVFVEYEKDAQGKANFKKPKYAIAYVSNN